MFYVQFFATCGDVISPGSWPLDLLHIVLPAPTSIWCYSSDYWQISNRLRPIILVSGGSKLAPVLAQAAL